MKRYNNLVGGNWARPNSNRWLPSVDPYRNEAWCEVPDSNEADVAAAVDAASAAFSSKAWAGLMPTARGALLRKLGDLIEANARRLAEIG